MISNIRRLSTIAAALALLIATVTAAAQNSQASLTGKYTGLVKDESGEQKTTLDLVEDSGKFSGTLTTARGSFKVLKGQTVNGTTTVEVEKPGGSSGTISLRKNGDVLVATFTEAGKNITIEFRKDVSDLISGEWEGVADAQGEALPFTLSLKRDGEKVVGSTSSQLGVANISTGTWKDGKLAIMLEGGAGQIAMIATMVDGKLSGDYDFAGQATGKWVAIKKK
jgi:hypothetical protein